MDVRDRIALAQRLADEHHFSRVVVRSGPFDLTAFVGPQRTNAPLQVYIEGDGFAWVTRHQPSRNPTPMDPVALKLAMIAGHDVVYLARPGQYVAPDDNECDARYWTSARFSSEVVDAMNDAITQLKRSMGARKLVLIGYSGGGALAALVAARRTDVVHLVTVAGNLDPAAWARWHGVPQLKASLNPRDYHAALANVRQTHFVGQRDRTVPIEVYRSYRDAFSGDADITVKIVPGMNHRCCWDQVWPELMRQLR